MISEEMLRQMDELDAIWWTWDGHSERKKNTVYLYDRNWVLLEKISLRGAKRIPEKCWWNGSEFISYATQVRWLHDTLYRLRDGRWLLCRWSQWEDDPPVYRLVPEDFAKLWLERNHRDEELKKYFGGES